MKLARMQDAAGLRWVVREGDDEWFAVPAEVSGQLDQSRFSAAFERLGEAFERGSLSPSPPLGPDGRIVAPIQQPSKIVCIGLNYRSHAEETQNEIPEEPMVFLKAPSALNGPFDPVLLPPGSERTDWEIELGVVIGQRASYLPDVDAVRGVIAGFCVSNDISERRYQLRRGGQFTKGKSCPTFNPLGPWLVPVSEVDDPDDLSMQLTLNGEVMQESSTREMIFSVAEIVHYVSQFMTLEPGDLINTGTPAGVGMARRRFLAAGDLVEATIEQLGTQRFECHETPQPGASGSPENMAH